MDVFYADKIHSVFELPDPCQGANAYLFVIFVSKIDEFWWLSNRKWSVWKSFSKLNIQFLMKNCRVYCPTQFIGEGLKTLGWINFFYTNKSPRYPHIIKTAHFLQAPLAALELLELSVQHLTGGQSCGALIAQQTHLFGEKLKIPPNDVSMPHKNTRTFTYFAWALP